MREGAPLGLAAQVDDVAGLAFGTLEGVARVQLDVGADAHVHLDLVAQLLAGGLLLLGAPFGFIALLGFLSLSGMLIKNCIVLVEQIKLELEEGKDAFNAVFDSAVSRVRPVSMAAITTILGMLPLLGDDFFASLAVVIMFGLGFATILTLLFLPVLYCSVFKIKTIQE